MRARVRLALTLVAVELGDGAAHLHRLFRASEHVQPPAHLGRRAQPATDPHVVADHAVLVDRHQPDVVDLVLRAVMHAGRYRHLELAGQVRELAVTDERPLQVGHQRSRVDQLVAVDSGQRATHDVAPYVAAGLREGQADRVQLVQHDRHVLDREVVQLDVLASGDVAHAAAVALGQRPHRPQLLRADDAARELDAEHEQAVRLLGRPGVAGGGRLGGALRVHAVPAEQRQVVGLDGVEAELGVAVDVCKHVQPVLAGLDVLDLRQLCNGFLRHGVAPSGWCPPP